MEIAVYLGLGDRQIRRLFLESFCIAKGVSLRTWLVSSIRSFLPAANSWKRWTKKPVTTCCGEMALSAVCCACTCLGTFRPIFSPAPWIHESADDSIFEAPSV